VMAALRAAVWGTPGEDRHGYGDTLDLDFEVALFLAFGPAALDAGAEGRV
jgi:hypothetical protein